MLESVGEGAATVAAEVAGGGGVAVGTSSAETTALDSTVPRETGSAPNNAHNFQTACQALPTSDGDGDDGGDDVPEWTKMPRRSEPCFRRQTAAHQRATRPYDFSPDPATANLPVPSCSAPMGYRSASDDDVVVAVVEVDNVSGARTRQTAIRVERAVPGVLRTRAATRRSCRP